jgi:hypothetical protein
VLKFGEKWHIIKEKMQRSTFTDTQHQEGFLKFFYYVITDVLSAIYHAKNEQTERQYCEDKYFSVLLDQAEFGPFCPS